MTGRVTARAKASFLSILDLNPDALERCFALSAQLKAERVKGRRSPFADRLGGAHVAMLFDKPSLRTRSTFEIAVREIGGEVVYLPGEVALGAREPVADVARNLERWVEAVIIRTFAQQTLVEFAAAAPRLHVVNALTNEEHPCQALADFFTLRETWGSLAGRTLAYIGDGNNVATSLAHTGALMGVNVHVASPEGYALPARVVEEANAAARCGAVVRQFHDPVEAVKGAGAVYTDVWTSMGQEDEARARTAAFAGFQVNEHLMAHAGTGALFMHCLPARRGLEVTDGVMESPASIVFDQAENRLHTQKALLLLLMREKDSGRS